MSYLVRLGLSGIGYSGRVRERREWHNCKFRISLDHERKPRPLTLGTDQIDLEMAAIIGKGSLDGVVATLHCHLTVDNTYLVENHDNGFLQVLRDVGIKRRRKVK